MSQRGVPYHLGGIHVSLRVTPPALNAVICRELGAPRHRPFYTRAIGEAIGVVVARIGNIILGILIIQRAANTGIYPVVTERELQGSAGAQVMGNGGDVLIVDLLGGGIIKETYIMVIIDVGIYTQEEQFLLGMI